MIFYQYVCSGCGSNLLASEVLIDPAKVRLRFNSICPYCKADLSNSVEWCRIKSDDSLSKEMLLTETSRHESEYPLRFQKINELQVEPRLFFGEEHIDRLLGNLHLGHVIFLYGSWRCLAASELLCVRAQLEPIHGGFDSDAIFIDGGNSFDSYLLVEYARRFSLNQDNALDRIFVSRAFNFHQLTTLVTQVLPQVVHERKIRLVVVSDLTELYLNAANNSQSINAFRILINSLKTTARAARVIVLTTCLKEGSQSDPFLHITKKQVDAILRFEEQDRAAELILEKHPTRPAETLVVGHKSTVLEDFLEETNTNSWSSDISHDNLRCLNQVL